MEDYKEKYEQALEWARKVIQGKIGFVLDDVLNKFPELKESEDEKIRKDIIRVFTGEIGYTTKDEAKKYITWLEKQDPKKHEEELENAYKCADEVQYRRGYEDAKCEFKKQGEQKPTDKVESKFKNGQWIVWQDKYYKVYDNGCGYELVEQNGLSKSLGYENINKNTHLWNIAKDAKDGDVLLFEGNYNSIVLFQGIGINGKERINYHCKCDLGNYSFGIQGDVACLGTVDKDAEYYHPATKEQCDILFQKMKEAGYEWDAEKKELTKIDARENLVLDGDLMQAGCMMIEQKSAWSEEDIMHFRRCIGYIEVYMEPRRDDVEWFKSLEYRYTWKPSDEQIEAVRIAAEIGTANNSWTMGVLKSMYQDLKKLKEE